MVTVVLAELVYDEMMVMAVVRVRMLRSYAPFRILDIRKFLQEIIEYSTTMVKILCLPSKSHVGKSFHSPIVMCNDSIQIDISNQTA